MPPTKARSLEVFLREGRPMLLPTDDADHTEENSAVMPWGSHMASTRPVPSVGVA